MPFMIESICFFLPGFLCNLPRIYSLSVYMFQGRLYGHWRLDRTYKELAFPLIDIEDITLWVSFQIRAEIGLNQGLYQGTLNKKKYLHSFQNINREVNWKRNFDVLWNKLSVKSIFLCTCVFQVWGKPKIYWKNFVVDVVEPEIELTELRW